ncbi:hypothetical protein A9Q87_09465 [Flavobacteriales bacterium 34_180_T64]|nr:hypothetical protein A9Q87_09465 [Flavobacteriales bacterium 34_180_T64]
MADQSNKSVEKSQKHDVNLQKNSTLYFQVGLILCLLGTYSLFEMNFETKVKGPIEVGVAIDEPTEFNVKNYVAEEIVTQEKKILKKKTKLVSQEPKIVKDDFKDKLIATLVTAEQNVTDKPASIEDITTIEAPDDEPQIFSLIGVEQVPIYPGCEKAGNNKERIKCMSSKLSKLILRKFNRDLASDLGLSGLQRIDVQFKIDKSGHVTDIKTRAPYSQLEKEALRLANKIPVMTPGKQRNKPVSVLYNLPIVFKVN